MQKSHQSTNANSKHIVLTGFMCSGKTTLGRQLSQWMNMPFLDMDEYITEIRKKSIAAIFADEGEAYFRQLEHECISALLQRQPATIIAAGGGTPCFHNNMELMNAVAITVYLKASPETLFARIQQTAHAHRPLLHNKTDNELWQYICRSLAERETCYRQAQIVFDTESDEMQNLISMILNL